MNELDQLKREVEELKAWKQQLESSSTIPLKIDQSFRGRFTGLLNLTVSAKSADSEDQAVSEGGAGAYDVMGDPDGFLQITINNTIYYLPYFT